VGGGLVLIAAGPLCAGEVSMWHRCGLPSLCCVLIERGAPAADLG